MIDDRWLSLTHDDDGWIVQPHPTREAAEARVAGWLEECDAWATTQGDGWPENMEAYVVSTASVLRETSWEDEETGEPFAEYRMEAASDPRDARIAELEAEVERLRALVPHPCAATPVVAQEGAAGERQPAPEPTPTHEAEWSPTPADGGMWRHPDDLEGHLTAWPDGRWYVLRHGGPDIASGQAEALDSAARAADEALARRVPTPEPALDPRHLPAESERVPTHEPEGTHLMPPAWLEEPQNTEHEQKAAAVSAAARRVRDAGRRMSAGEDAAAEFTAALAALSRLLGEAWTCTNCDTDYAPIGDAPRCPKCHPSPTHEDIDRHPDPMRMAELVLGMKWCASDVCLGSRFLDRPSASRTALHLYLDGRLTPPDGAPGWGAWEWES